MYVFGTLNFCWVQLSVNIRTSSSSFELYSFDTKSLKWTLHEEVKGEVPSRRGGYAMVAISQTLHLVSSREK
eukprot:767978-Hanusia_phi.AAC.3